MQTEVKNSDMTVAIADLAKEFEMVPGQVYGVLDDLGIQHDQANFEAEHDELDLIRDSLREHKGSKQISLQPNRTPRDIASALGVPQPEVQKALMKRGVMATITTALKPEIAEQLAEQFGYILKWADAPKPRPKAPTAAQKKKAEGAQPRPPVVTIMGHVDHGKTSLLDFIRKTSVAAKEHGGITQHIGAYQVELPEGKITFLDTPGHAAFTAMRARGAQVTDIAILVVAADDGLMPQSIEAINHIKAAEVPMIVAVNKIDRQEANPDKVLQQLLEHEVVPEAFGGQVITNNVSAITGEGIPQLLESILLQAEVMELKADPKAELEGVVVEARLEKGRGPVATILVEEGTLRIGDAILAGNTFGRIKAMTDYKRERLAEAGPSTPVEVLGLSDVPQAGDKIEWAEDERSAREIADRRREDQRVKGLEAPKRSISLQGLRDRLTEGALKQLNLVVKADVQGSVEAVRGMLEKIANEEVETHIMHSGVGSIVESDVLLASAAEAICIGFNVKPEPGAKIEAERRGVEIRTYTIIYELIEDIEKAAKGMLEPKFEEQYQGMVEIRMVFKLSTKGVIAGSHCTDGKITRGSQVRVYRVNPLAPPGERGKGMRGFAGEVVYEGKVATLKHVKEDVREITAGFDCGITFDGWQAFKEGDVIEAYERIQVNA